MAASLNAGPGVWKPVFSMDNSPGSLAQESRRQKSRARDRDASAEDDADYDDEDLAEDDDDGSEAGSPANSRRGHGRVSSLGLPGTAQRNLMQNGATAPRKPVHLDWDSDDEIIWQMKAEGYKDEPIRDRLVEENRTRYDAKTIATRYSRMRRMMAAHEEQTLDDAFSDFHEHEDTMLKSAVEEAEDEYQQELVKADRRRWQAVAEIMKREIGRSKWTKNTTKARYESLENGSAIVPVERDPNAAARTAQRLHERLERQAAAEAKRLTEKSARDEIIRRRLEERERKESEREKNEIEREERRVANLQRKAEAKAKAEEKAKNKQELEERKAAKAVMTAVEREQKRRAKEEEQAAKRWQKDQEKVARQQAAQEAELAKLQAEADAKRAALEDLNENNQRRELIRRFMRDAGLKTAAPVPSGILKTDENEKEATADADLAPPKRKRASAPGRKSGVKQTRKQTLSSETVGTEDDSDSNRDE